MDTRCQLSEPLTETGRLFHPLLQYRMRSMYEEPSQVLVPPLANAQQLLLAAGGILPWNQPQPGSKTSPLLERRSVADRRDHSGCYDRADTRNFNEPLAGFVFAGHPPNHRVGFVDLTLEMPHLRIGLQQKHAQRSRQLAVCIFQDPG